MDRSVSRTGAGELLEMVGQTCLTTIRKSWTRHRAATWLHRDGRHHRYGQNLQILHLTLTKQWSWAIFLALNILVTKSYAIQGEIGWSVLLDVCWFLSVLLVAQQWMIFKKCQQLIGQIRCAVLVVSTVHCLGKSNNTAHRFPPHSKTCLGDTLFIHNAKMSKSRAIRQWIVTQTTTAIPTAINIHQLKRNSSARIFLCL